MHSSSATTAIGPSERSCRAHFPALAALFFGLALFVTTGFAWPSVHPQRDPRHAPLPRPALPLGAMAMLRNLIVSAAGAGLAVCLAVAGVQIFTTEPLILHAESLREGRRLRAGGRDGDAGDDRLPPTFTTRGRGSRPTGWSARSTRSLADLVIGVAVSLMLLAAMVLKGDPIDARRGLSVGRVPASWRFAAARRSACRRNCRARPRPISSAVRRGGWRPPPFRPAADRPDRLRPALVARVVGAGADRRPARHRRAAIAELRGAPIRPACRRVRRRFTGRSARCCGRLSGLAAGWLLRGACRRDASRWPRTPWSSAGSAPARAATPRGWCSRAARRRSISPRPRPATARWPSASRVHRERRGAAWRTVEEPLDLPGALRREAQAGRTVLVDCLTLWLANLMGGGAPMSTPRRDRLIAALAMRPARVVLVTNEVGSGIIPDNALARALSPTRSARSTSRSPRRSDRVVLVAAGLPLILKANSTEAP